MDLHTSSVKTSMHRIGLLSFLRSIFAEKARAYREPFSTNSSFWLNSKVQNEIIIQYQKILNRCRMDGSQFYWIFLGNACRLLGRYSSKFCCIGGSHSVDGVFQPDISSNCWWCNCIWSKLCSPDAHFQHTERNKLNEQTLWSLDTSGCAVHGKAAGISAIPGLSQDGFGGQ